MHTLIKKNIEGFRTEAISAERKAILQPLINYIQIKIDKQEVIRLNYICTHNSRRSHLSQIWSQAMAYHFGIKNVFCYSGGTEVTAMFPQIVTTLTEQGFKIEPLSQTENPVYAIKYAENEPPVIGFSKIYQHHFNPISEFAAVITCSNADAGCPLVTGADARFRVQYNDPKAFDNTVEMEQKYAERSLEIAKEMWYVYSQLKVSK
jgi:arsenate reductase